MSKIKENLEKNAYHKVTRGTTANFLDKLGDLLKAIGDMVHPDKK